MFVVGGGSRSAAYCRVLASLAGRVVTVPDAEELVATGACVQAAAVLQQRLPIEVANAWGLGAGTTVEPDESVDRLAIREGYRAAAG
jgi:xylulokinase